MRYSEIEEGCEYLGSHGRGFKVIEKLGTHEERLSAHYTKTRKQALRVLDLDRGGERIIEARSLKGPWQPHRDEAFEAYRRLDEVSRQIDEIVQALEPLGARGRITGSARSDKPAELHLSAAAVGRLHQLLISADSSGDDALARALNVDG